MTWLSPRRRSRRCDSGLVWKARHKARIYHVIPERKAVNLVTRIRFGIARGAENHLAILRRRAISSCRKRNDPART